MGGGGWPGMVLVFLLLVLAAVWACNLLRSRRQSHGDRRDSLEILKRRLAAGEISLEEFENLKKVL
jgi:putative membrane protein